MFMGPLSLTSVTQLLQPAPHMLPIHTSICGSSCGPHTVVVMIYSDAKMFCWRVWNKGNTLLGVQTFTATSEINMPVSQII